MEDISRKALTNLTDWTFSAAVRNMESGAGSNAYCLSYTMRSHLCGDILVFKAFKIWQILVFCIAEIPRP